MKININDFRVHEKDAIAQYEKFGIDSLSLYSAVSSCPIIAVYYYIKEFTNDENEKKELEKRINGLVEFYRYDEVLNG